MSKKTIRLSEEGENLYDDETFIPVPRSMRVQYEVLPVDDEVILSTPKTRTRTDSRFFDKTQSKL